MSSDYDVIVIGAGHNGLVCACYLARAGYRVLCLERRHIVGGAVITESDIFPGYNIDTCSAYHVVIHGTPIVADLDLASYGLDYIDVDPWAYAPFPNGKSITFYRSVERTCESIARVSAHDAEAYRRFMRTWMPFNELMMAVFTANPSPGGIAAAMGKKALRNPRLLGSFLGRGAGGTLGLFRSIFGNYGQMIKENFESEEMRAALAWLGAQSGPGPDEAASGELLAMQQSLYHLLGVRRPRGGSGGLTKALARCLEAAGGTVRTSAEVERIIVRGGKVVGVRLKNGDEFGASVVVSNAHVQTTLLRLTDPADISPTLRRRVENIKVVGGFGMTVRCATNALPRYDAYDFGAHMAGVEDCHSGMQLLCPSFDYLQQAYHEAALGLPPTAPAVIAMTPSAIDPTLAPDGKQVLYIWAQNHPYDLRNGETWEAIREREAQKCLDVVARFAPNMRDAIEGVYIKSPRDLEEIGGLIKGHLMHIDMSIDQMFMFRPLPELSGYRTPLPGLYLTGASTHPGGGVSGASGRNTARVVLKDTAKRRSRL